MNGCVCLPRAPSGLLLFCCWLTVNNYLPSSQYIRFALQSFFDFLVTSPWYILYCRVHVTPPANACLQLVVVPFFKFFGFVSAFMFVSIVVLYIYRYFVGSYLLLDFLQWRAPHSSPRSCLRSSLLLVSNPSSVPHAWVQISMQHVLCFFCVFFHSMQEKSVRLSFPLFTKKHSI